MRDHGDALAFSPRLPPNLSRLQVRLVHRGRHLRVEVSPELVTYEVVAGAPLIIEHEGERLELTAHRPESRTWSVD
jgi:alpha,alpha-trehalose phosphorylase